MPRRIAIETSLVDNEIDILISDNGPGVSREIRRRIFDPFFTTKPQGVGTGIGLAFSLGVVRAHNGRLELLDNGSGAHFRLRLPIETGTVTESEEGETPFSKGGVGRTALVVDDEPDVAEMVADVDGGPLLQQDGSLAVGEDRAEDLVDLDAQRGQIEPGIGLELAGDHNGPAAPPESTDHLWLTRQP